MGSTGFFSSSNQDLRSARRTRLGRSVSIPYVCLGASVHPLRAQARFTSSAMSNTGASPYRDKRDSISSPPCSTRSSKPEIVPPDRWCARKSVPGGSNPHAPFGTQDLRLNKLVPSPVLEASSIGRRQQTCQAAPSDTAPPTADANCSTRSRGTNFETSSGSEKASNHCTRAFRSR